MTRINGRNPIQWTPMYPVFRVPIPPEKIDTLRKVGASDEEIDHLANQEVWRNNLYIVMVERSDDGFVTELSIRRADRKPMRDWRHFQRIKTEIAGPDVEAVELYPSENRLMDTANQYYLYCLRPGMRCPFGYDTGRNLRDTDEVKNVGAVQRPLPHDWKNVGAVQRPLPHDWKEPS